ncbi:alpha/beta fold hydrolase [Hymenobacter terrenus]|uniref:alpha/beta fold hydrolase n=1 Tax=Hymenobacter terrenus TaxID=1629124 RepID=UPI0006199898|nr:alpha/beta fold hydrolase [Hymenobacter terrenus]
MNNGKLTYVLVHGAFAGQYAWQLVKPRLEQAGHKVITFDLPGHGDDPTPAAQVTFESYVRTVVDHINAEAGQVVLVGHSMGGMVISQVAEQIPDKLAKLVYLSAYLPQNGQSIQDLSGAGDSESLIGPNLKLAADYSTASLPTDIAVQVFAGDCSDDIKKLVAATNKPEPLAPFQAQVALTAANFGRVPKYYIETLHDQGVGTALQKQMVSSGAVAKVYTLESGHSPYFAKPAELVTILEELP